MRIGVFSALDAEHVSEIAISDVVRKALGALAVSGNEVSAELPLVASLEGRGAAGGIGCGSDAHSRDEEDEKIDKNHEGCLWKALL